MRRELLNLLHRFGRDERGMFAVIFGLMAVVLVALSGAVVDYVALQQQESRAQIALDASALALQPLAMKKTHTKEQIRVMAENLVLDRLGGSFGVKASVPDITIDDEKGTLWLRATLEVPTSFVSLVGVPKLATAVVSEAAHGTSDIEVGVAVDITGSMNQLIATDEEDDEEQAKIVALREALNTLIDILVKDEQEPTYTKMAIVPYSMAVNVGDAYASTFRGSITPTTPISAVAWAAGSGKVITNATRANPVVISATTHGFANGDRIFIDGVGGMSQINRRVFTVAGVTTNSFQLSNENGTNYGAYTASTGTATKCLNSACEHVVTSTGHGLSTNDYAFIFNAGGMRNYPQNSPQAAFNNNTDGYTSGTSLAWPVGATTTNSFVLTGSSRANGDYGTYTTGGGVSCVKLGCEYYYFRNQNGSMRRHRISTCVSERTANAYTSAPATVTPLGRAYHSATLNPCLTNTVMPLTPDKTALHNKANSLVAGGSTAGHVGLAWGWYMVSPHFNAPWPAISQPADASARNVIRAVILMTDGEFNSVYCNGVISQSSISGSGDNQSKINCNAPNGGSYAQSMALCNAMKSENVQVYTVGFAIVNAQAATDLMEDCATDENHSYVANSGQELIDVFAEIGRDLSQLRITQ